MSHQHYLRLIETLAAAAHLEDLAPNAAGLCRLRYNDMMEISIQSHPDDQDVRFFVDLGAVPEDAESCHRKMLELNYGCISTGGAALAVHQDRIFLCHSIPVEGLDPMEFARLVGNLLDRASNLHAELFPGASTNRLENFHEERNTQFRL